MPQRMLQELSTDECWKHLAGRTVGRLAVSVAGKPDIFPVNYRIDSRTLVVRTAPGFKLAAATLGPAVAFEVDHVDEVERTGWSVVVHGTATEVQELDELLDADDLDIQPWVEGPKSRYMRIVPDEVTGRRIPR